MNDKGTVKVNFTIENLPKIYTETGQTWEDESVSYDLQISEEGGAGKLEINKADVLPDEIEGVIELIEKKADTLLMVYKFKTSCFYSDLKKEWQKYCVDGKGIFTLEEEIHVEDIKGWLAPDGYTVLRATVLPPIVHMSCESSKIEFPNLKELKGIDDNLKRHLLTYIQTKELNSLSGNYHDDILKRWFLILEEIIEEDTGNMDYQNIKRARHFVSHSICDTKSGRKVIDFLKRELRASVYQDCEKKEVACFDRRNADHILFVEKYARIAEDRVKMLLESML